MDLNKKIDEIRSKPEHIRLRYVWGAVGICMFFILVFWIFSIKEIFSGMNVGIKSSGSCLTDFRKEFEKQSQEEPSIKKMLDQADREMKANIAAQENNYKNEENEESKN